VPIIGASGFAAIATAAGHTAGSVAVAASFGGEPNKMLPDYFYSGDTFFISHHFFVDFYSYILYHLLIVGEKYSSSCRHHRSSSNSSEPVEFGNE
jgi:glyoxylase-like metal-dependent hydrolase (beta-lactamase superfamily II)